MSLPIQHILMKVWELREKSIVLCSITNVYMHLDLTTNHRIAEMVLFSFLLFLTSRDIKRNWLDQSLYQQFFFLLSTVIVMSYDSLYIVRYEYYLPTSFSLCWITLLPRQALGGQHSIYNLFYCKAPCHWGSYNLVEKIGRILDVPPAMLLKCLKWIHLIIHKITEFSPKTERLPVYICKHTSIY